MLFFKKKLPMLEAYVAAKTEIDLTLRSIARLITQMPQTNTAVLDAVLFESRPLEITFNRNWTFAVFSAAAANAHPCARLCRFAIDHYERGDLLRNAPIKDFFVARTKLPPPFYADLLEVIFDASFNCGWKLDGVRLPVLDLKHLRTDDFIEGFTSNIKFVRNLGERFKFVF